MGALCVLASVPLLYGATETTPVANDLLQRKEGAFDYLFAIARLAQRDPARDAREDLAGGNKDLYCVGTLACSTPGLDADEFRNDFPKDLTTRATAHTGCVIMGGQLEMAYRHAEERYVAAYNQAKVRAARSAVKQPAP